MCRPARLDACRHRTEVGLPGRSVPQSDRRSPQRRADWKSGLAGVAACPLRARLRGTQGSAPVNHGQGRAVALQQL
jgi:hypothetical protein